MKNSNISTTGCLAINKQTGMTSHDVVDIVRKKLNTRKVGHAGTLDPDATGVLVLGIGVGTKLLEFVTGSTKTYKALIKFGSSTSTLDSSGEVTDEVDMAGLKESQVQRAAQQFVGTIKQIPPMVSAVKIDGKRLHEIARSGKVIDRPAREVIINSFKIEPTDDPMVYSATVDCSSGTYIRTLADDLGKAVNGLAHLYKLERTRVGNFGLSDCIIADNVNITSLLSLDRLVSDLPILEIPDDLLDSVRNGKSLGESAGAGCLAIKDSAGQLIAIYKVQSGILKAYKVLAAKG